MFRELVGGIVVLLIFGAALWVMAALVSVIFYVLLILFVVGMIFEIIMEVKRTWCIMGSGLVCDGGDGKCSEKGCFHARIKT